MYISKIKKNFSEYLLWVDTNDYVWVAQTVVAILSIIQTMIIFYISYQVMNKHKNELIKWVLCFAFTFYLFFETIDYDLWMNCFIFESRVLLKSWHALINMPYSSSRLDFQCHFEASGTSYDGVVCKRWQGQGSYFWHKSEIHSYFKWRKKYDTNPNRFSISFRVTSVNCFSTRTFYWRCSRRFHSLSRYVSSVENF